MPNYYLATDLFNRPAVTPEEAARNKHLAKLALAAGRKPDPNKPTRPRAAQRGLFPVGQSAFYELRKSKRVPEPDAMFGRRPVWRAETIHRTLRELGLPVPEEETTPEIAH